MKKTGLILKQEREKRGLSLHEIGLSLKINPKILRAIEEGETQNLPAKTFLRGFVKSYGQFLRLDLKTLMDTFQEETGELSAPPPSQDSSQVTPETQPQVQKPVSTPINEKRAVGFEIDGNKILYIVASLFMIGLIVFSVRMIEKYQEEKDTSQAEALAQTVVSTTLPPEPGPMTPTSESTTTTLLPGLSSAPAAPAASAATTSTLVTTTTLRSTTTTTTTTSTTTTMRPQPTTTTLRPTTTTLPVTTTTMGALAITTTTTPSTTTTTMKSQRNIEVIVEAMNKVNIKYTFADGVQRSLDLNADQVHTFRTRGKMTLEISDGGAVSVIVNGRDRGVPGVIGKSLTLSLP